MKRISLTQGQYAIVDDDMFDYLNQFKWFANWNKDTQSFYAWRKSKKKDDKRHTIPMAREILGLKQGDKHQGDHKDHNTLDNRMMNLRIVTSQQNNWNRKSPKGYSWNRGTFQAQIMASGKSIFLGRFHTTKEAHNAYLKAKEIYHKF